MNIIRPCFTHILLTICGILVGCSTSFAQKQRFTPEHEFRLGIGALPLFADIFELDYDYDYYIYTPSDKYDELLKYNGNTRSTGSITAGYTCRFTRLIALGASASYSGIYRNTYDASNSKKLATTRLDYFMLTPMVRLSWLNRKNVRLYSQAGLGMGIVLHEDQRLLPHQVSRSTTFVSMQMTFIGVTVGRKLFGFSEVGVGSQGTFIIGIGYRFNSKSR